MTQAMILYPHGSINSNLDLKGIIDILIGQGYRVDIYSRRRALYNQEAPCKGAEVILTDLIDPLDTAILFAPNVLMSEETITCAESTFRKYDLVIGVDLGVIEACMVAKIIRVPYGLISFELDSEQVPVQELREPAVIACRNLNFAVSRDKDHAERLSADYLIPLDKIINSQLRTLDRIVAKIDPHAHWTGSNTAQSVQSPTFEEMERLVELLNQGRNEEAEVIARHQTKNFPQHGDSWKILGAVLKLQGRFAESLEPMQKAALLLPMDAGAHSNLGVCLNDMDRLEEAEASLRRALEIKPDYAEALSNLGITLKGLGRLEEAKTSYLLALGIKPDFAEAYCNLGVTFKDLDRPKEAEASYRSALRLKPNYGEALNNLALLLDEQGQSLMALNTIKQSLRIKETGEAKNIFVSCVNNLSFTHVDSETQATLAQALTELWCSPSELVRAATEMIKLNPEIGGCIARAVDAWPLRLSSSELFGENSLTSLEVDPLLCILLNSALICDIDMERFLTMARYAMLEEAAEMMTLDFNVDSVSKFYCALTSQCFINEYVFSYTDDEIQKAGDLRNSLVDMLEANTQAPAIWLMAVAAYFPLSSLPHASRLLDSKWPEEVATVLAQHISEPEEELQERTSIPRLTVIEDVVSLQVQNQYEKNPYPRWIKAVSAGKGMYVVEYLSQRFPLTCFNHHTVNDNNSVDILIAGCGTGQHPIGTAQRFQGAKVLAVDLSLSSLGYAKRKTSELGLTSIEYAQADLLKMGSLGRSFDVIESCGVLHHLSDPWTGWHVLLSLLRPGGFMKVGLYSEMARRGVSRIRTLIDAQGYGTTVDEIRRCRQNLLDLDKSENYGPALINQDFFSISTCRDLLFHAHEHLFTLTSIDRFLKDNSLLFLGFEIDKRVLKMYKSRFPDDRTATNLVQWNMFESENPDTFLGMYQFWIQKMR